MAFIGDVSRGLSILRRNAQDRADEITALEAIDAAGGIGRLVEEARTQTESAEGAKQEALAALAQTNADLETARLALARVEAEADAVRNQAHSAAEGTLNEARAMAEQIIAKAEQDAAGRLSTAVASATATTGAADAKAAQKQAESDALDDRIAAKRSELADIAAKLDKARADHKRFLDTLTNA